MLGGITRATVIELARDKGIPVEERAITRDELYTADEVFLTGTAAELTPIREIDRRTIGAGSRGPIAATLQKAFFDVVSGREAKYERWLTYVSRTPATAPARAGRTVRARRHRPRR